MTEPTVGSVVTIRKLKYQSGDLWMMWQWEDTVWHNSGEFWMAFEAPGTPFWRPDKVFLGTDYAILYFYPSQPYYFYELYEPLPPHKFRGWYCNINLPPEPTDDGYSFVDIDLDIWLYPDLHYEVLDQEEYRENAVRHNYPAAYKQIAEQTLEDLRERIARREFPFRPHIEFLQTGLEFLAERFGKPAVMPPPLATDIPPSQEFGALIEQETAAETFST